MRPILALALALSLALASGCVGKGGDDPPAAEPSLASTEAAPGEPAPEAEDEPASSAPQAAPAPASGPANATAPSVNATPPPPPEPPQPAPWNLSATASLGWAVAAGARTPDPVGQTAEEGQVDATHCPDAAFTLPPGTATLTLSVAEAFATAGENGAGAFRILVYAPDGNTTVLEPAMPSGPQATAAEATFDSPLGGPWALHAEPVGPAVQQAWDVSILAERLSLAAPNTLDARATC